MAIANDVAGTILDWNFIWTVLDKSGNEIAPSLAGDTASVVQAGRMIQPSFGTDFGFYTSKQLPTFEFSGKGVPAVGGVRVYDGRVDSSAAQTIDGYLRCRTVLEFNL